MVTLSTLFTFSGFWFCYQTSQRAELGASNRLVLWIRNNRRKGNQIGVAGLIVGLVLSMITFGVGSGIFSFMMILTTVASMVILLGPLGYIKVRNIGMVAIISIVLELVI